MPGRRSQQQVRSQNLAILIATLATAAAAVWWLGANRGGTARVDTRAPAAETAGNSRGQTTGAPSDSSPASSATSATPATSAASETTGAGRTFTLAVTGDLLGHSPVNDRAAANGAASGADYDYRPMFELVRPILSAADLALCHLETPLAEPGGPVHTAGLTFSVPGELAAAIADAGYDGCSTASNHTLDRGTTGVEATLARLDDAGLRHTGSARSPEEAGPAWYDVNGVRVAHLSYTYGLNGYSPPNSYAVNLIDADRVVADARAAREAGAEFVIVSLHWGAEHHSDPTTEQMRVATAVTASPDVDLVVGHHAHVVQPVAVINYKYVVYGLGNFLSNQHPSSCCPVESQDGVVVGFDVAETAPGSGLFGVTAVRAEPTWVDRSTFTIVPVDPGLADPSTPAGLRADLEASRARTIEVLGRLGITVLV